MSDFDLKYLRNSPSTALRSVWLSRKHQPGSITTPPIVSVWSTRITRPKDATMSLGGQLFLGYWPDEIHFEDRGPDHEPDNIMPFAVGETRIHMGRRSRFETGGWVLLGPGVQVVLGRDASISIGDGTYITANAYILASTHVTIGATCAIAFDSMIMDSDSHVLKRDGVASDMAKPVHIGDHVWIGAGARLLKGATVGDGAVIAAGAVVTGEIPPHTLAGGVPARVLRENVKW